MSPLRISYHREKKNKATDPAYTQLLSTQLEKTKHCAVYKLGSIVLKCFMHVPENCSIQKQQHLYLSYPKNQ